jgi:dehydrogenase/reductase SDR family member 4
MGQRFLDKVVVITGASRGIGQQIAVGFAAEGAKVVLVSRKIAALEEVTKQIADAGGHAFPLACHIGDMAQIAAAVAAVKEKYGRIDVLVNNAATNPVFGPVMFTEEDAFQKIFDVNVKGPFFLSKGVMAAFQEQGGGVIVNVASTAGLSPMPGLGIYSASKSALIGLGKVMAYEWGPFGIRVNTVCPGLIKTKFSKALWDSEEILAKVIDTQKIKRLGEPRDVVGTVLFLASDDSAFMTGQVVVVDGGALM